MDAKIEIAERIESFFLKYGFRSVTMDDVARELRMSKKTLYQYFDNKDDLVETVVNNHIEKEHEEINELRAASANALDEMYRIAKMYIDHLEKISPSAVYDLQKYYSALWVAVLKKQDEFDIECITNNLKRGQKEGYFHKNINNEIVAKIFTKATMMLVNEMADKNSKHSRRKLVKELHDYHIRSVATPEGLAAWEKLSKNL